MSGAGSQSPAGAEPRADCCIAEGRGRAYLFLKGRAVCSDLKEGLDIANALSAAIPPADQRDAALKSLDDDKAEDVVVIDLSGKSSIADYMVVATGRSTRHVASMAENLMERFGRELHLPVKAEGLAQGDWVLIDAGDVIVHLFRPEVRAFYNLEQMWTVEPKQAPHAVSGI